MFQRNIHTFSLHIDISQNPDLVCRLGMRQWLNDFGTVVFPISQSSIIMKQTFLSPPQNPTKEMFHKTVCCFPTLLSMNMNLSFKIIHSNERRLRVLPFICSPDYPNVYFSPQYPSLMYLWHQKELM